ncbi:DoxX family protein [Citrifermentans bemidjiense Bem]|uniref:DoxX family protein n=1 Tax=Citrifermentans bemidjiense (strain ATCC BAA-1014 / DSM 16622 / JCM 12645 / Bem) TaxID=404380 RepID=B5ECC7_CITBB|nr:DoxX family protein [Citrifermentans bemidjiense]ACH37555.1 DoxX family protein [Citrifermentans bemidjiense Bem]
MFNKILATRDDINLTIVRVFLGLVFFPHGAQKMLGWFGGPGFSGTMQMFTQNMKVPMVFAFLAICAEFLGSLGLLVGLCTRIAAFGILSNMAVAIFMVHLPNGFFMNWTGKQSGEGFEYHLLVLGMALALIVGGGGKASLDRKIAVDPTWRTPH